MASEKSLNLYTIRLLSWAAWVPMITGKAYAFPKNRLTAFVWCALLSVSVAACAKSASQATGAPASAPQKAAVYANSDAVASAPFAGHWESCAAGDAPEQCSRYILLQHGKRICGTWSYFASGDGYEGKVIAEAISPLEARRTRICGRPGSETGMECETGWETIDRPLRLCGGKLGDLDGKNGSCFADFERFEGAGPSLKVLAEQPWIQACLSRAEEAQSMEGPEAPAPKGPQMV